MGEQIIPSADQVGLGYNPVTPLGLGWDVQVWIGDNPSRFGVGMNKVAWVVTFITLWDLDGQ